MPLRMPELSYSKHNNIHYVLEENGVRFDIERVSGVEREGYDTAIKLYKEKHDYEPFDEYNKKDSDVPDEVVKYLCNLAEVCWKKANPVEYIKDCYDLGLFPYFTGCITLEVDGTHDEGILLNVSCLDSELYNLYFYKSMKVTEDKFFNGSLGDMQWVSKYTNELLDEFKDIDVGKVVFTFICDVSVPHKYATFKELYPNGANMSYKVIQWDEYAEVYTAGYLFIEDSYDYEKSRIDWADAWNSKNFDLIKYTK